MRKEAGRFHNLMLSLFLDYIYRIALPVLAGVLTTEFLPSHSFVGGWAGFCLER